LATVINARLADRPGHETGALVTALIPVKRYVARYLRESVESLLAQTSPHWRALIIHMPRAAAELEAQLQGATHDPRITMIEQRGRKLAGALNTGMRATQTRFAAILLADDLWAPHAVKVLNREIAAAPEVDFFHSSRRIIDDGGEPISGVHTARSEVSAEMFIDGGPAKHLLCWRVDFALAIGGIDESLNSVGADDYDFPWSMLEAGARFGAVQECLYIYRDHRSGYRLTTHLPLATHEKEMRRIMEKHGVPQAMIAARLAKARETYLRQCLYASTAAAWWGRITRRSPVGGWRDSYR
jgi:glycosyltransferase involved in cell wall biosynthesis